MGQFFEPLYISISDAPEPNLFSLAEKGHKLPPPPVDYSSDLKEDLDDMDITTGGINSEVTQMWRQFLLDITVKTPVRSGSANESYFTVSRVDRLSAGEKLFNNNKLSDMWTACQFKVGNSDDWKLAFRHLFPPHGTKTSNKIQNYLQCKYYVTWQRICDTADASTANAIRQQLL